MRNKKGISLVVLVITIIVMIILAASVVITLSNTGIINRANTAVDITNEKEVEQYVQLLWAEAYLQGHGKWTQDEIWEYMDNKLSEDIKNKYEIEVTVKGTEVVPSSEWKLEHVTDEDTGLITEVNVKKGSLEIPVGTKINYTVDGYIGEWKILGVDENGRLRIMTAGNVVESQNLGSDDDSEVAKSDYVNSVTILNNLCSTLDKGMYAVANSARSLKIEDIDALISYDKTTYALGKVYAYGNEVTYSWQGTDFPKYTYGESSSGTLSYKHDNGFTYYKDGVWKTVPKATTGTITTLTNDCYTYTGSTYMDDSIDAYKMLFNSGTYWLASPCVKTDVNRAYFGVRLVYSGSIANYGIFNSNGDVYGDPYAVKATVALSADIQIKYDETTKMCTII